MVGLATGGGGRERGRRDAGLPSTCLESTCNGNNQCISCIRFASGCWIPENNFFDCLPRPVTTCVSLNFCNERGSCQVFSATFASCNCDAGWTGSSCEQAITTPITTTCADLKFCYGHGECDDSISISKCECNPGWVGATCSTEDPMCGTRLCLNGGTCVRSVTPPLCNCPTGFDGESCETDLSQPICQPTCQMGVCSMDNMGVSECTCTPGYGGSACDTQLPCNLSCNRGSCKHGTMNTMTCECPALAFGPKCEEDCANCNIQTETCSIIGDPPTSVECLPIEKSVCQTNTNICHNGCTCDDGALGGFDYTCSNKVGSHFLGKRCQYDQPLLICDTDSITISASNDMLAPYSDAKYIFGVGDLLELKSAGSSSSITIPRLDFAKISEAKLSANGKITFESRVKLDINSDIFGNAVTPIFDFMCEFGIVVPQVQITPLAWPRATVSIDAQVFEIEMKFFSLDASFASTRQSRSSAVAFVGEEVFVNVAPTSAAFDSFPELNGDSNIRIRDCFLIRGTAGGGDDAFQLIKDGKPTAVTGINMATFATPQPLKGKEFKLMILNWATSASMSVKCTADLCSGVACAQAGRRRRSLSHNLHPGGLTVEDLLERHLGRDHLEDGLEIGPFFPTDIRNSGSSLYV